MTFWAVRQVAWRKMLIKPGKRAATHAKSVFHGDELDHRFGCWKSLASHYDGVSEVAMRADMRLLQEVPIKPVSS